MSSRKRKPKSEREETILAIAREMFPSYDTLSSQEKMKIIALLKDLEKQEEKVNEILVSYREVFRSRWQLRTKCWNLEKRIEELREEKDALMIELSNYIWTFSEN